MPKKYIKLGTIKQRRGIQLYEYQFNEGLLCDGNTDVFVLKRALKNNAPQPTVESDACTCDPAKFGWGASLNGQICTCCGKIRTV